MYMYCRNLFVEKQGKKPVILLTLHLSEWILNISHYWTFQQQDFKFFNIISFYLQIIVIVHICKNLLQKDFLIINWYCVIIKIKIMYSVSHNNTCNIKINFIDCTMCYIYKVLCIIAKTKMHTGTFWQFSAKFFNYFILRVGVCAKRNT